MAAVTMPSSSPHRYVRLDGPRASAATYRRRRLVVAVCALGLVLAVRWALAGLGGPPLSPSEPAPAPATRLVSGTVHVVAPGDTLWTIARALQPDGDVRPLVDALAAQRDGRPLQEGERISLP